MARKLDINLDMDNSLVVGELGKVVGRHFEGGIEQRRAWQDVRVLRALLGWRLRLRLERPFDKFIRVEHAYNVLVKMRFNLYRLIFEYLVIIKV